MTVPPPVVRANATYTDRHDVIYRMLDLDEMDLVRRVWLAGVAFSDTPARTLFNPETGSLWLEFREMSLPVRDGVPVPYPWAEFVAEARAAILRADL